MCLVDFQHAFLLYLETVFSLINILYINISEEGHHMLNNKTRIKWRWDGLKKSRSLCPLFKV